MRQVVQSKSMVSPMTQLLACKEQYLKMGGAPGFLDEEIKNFTEPAHQLSWESLLRHGFLDENVNKTRTIPFSNNLMEEITFHANLRWKCVREEIVNNLLQDFTRAQISPTLAPHLTPIVDQALELTDRLFRTIPHERVEILPGEKALIHGIEGYDEPLVLEATATKCLGTVVYENTKA